MEVAESGAGNTKGKVQVRSHLGRADRGLCLPSLYSGFELPGSPGKKLGKLRPRKVGKGSD